MRNATTKERGTFNIALSNYTRKTKCLLSSTYCRFSKKQTVVRTNNLQVNRKM